jgi:hypothetical protein
MNSKTIGLGLLVLGIILAGLGAAADSIGLGDPKEFGYRQIAAVVVGAVVAVAGVVVAIRKPAAT